MLNRKEIEELATSIEDGEVKTGADVQITIWLVIALMDIRDQLDRLGEIMMDFQIHQEIRDTFKHSNFSESEGKVTIIKNKRTGQVFEGDINDEPLGRFIINALISLGVLEEQPAPVSPEQVEAASQDFEKSVAEKAAAAEQTKNSSLLAGIEAEKIAAAGSAIEKAKAAEAAALAGLAVQKAAEKAAAAEAQAKLDHSQKN